MDLDALARFGPLSTHQQMIDQIQGFRQDLTRETTDFNREMRNFQDVFLMHFINTRVRLVNYRELITRGVEPLQKLTRGSGLDRAVAVLPLDGQAPAVTDAAVGTPMPQWVGEIDAWDDDYVLRAIEHYNEDFGIL
ncbi:hypothetical protein BDN72DRAFT_833497 [Pluteus cervinus]|uniref:Uncharacterized protein n=1 Tax=Pluteus cervinus TaxID=181527 RepID=A0ACD3BA40_9AGAR|nr:hypothetical protein BDN72DRAFT_833497 [Pluteus cervinus]